MTRKILNVGCGIWNVVRSFNQILEPGGYQYLILSIAGLILDACRLIAYLTAYIYALLFGLPVPTDE